MYDKSSESKLSSLPSTRSNLCSSQSTVLQQKPISLLKNYFSQWIRSLPMEQRFLAVKIYVPEIAQVIRKILLNLQGVSVQRPSEQSGDNLFPMKTNFRKIQKNFYDSLVLVSDGHDFLDNICFDFSLLECPEKLSDLLLNYFEGSASTSLGELLKQRTSCNDLLERLRKVRCREELSKELYIFLRQQVLVRFSQNLKNKEIISKGLEEQKRRKKEFSNYWKYLSQDMKHKLLLLGNSDINELIECLAEQQILVKGHELQREIEDFIKLEKNDFCNRIFKCKLKRLQSPLINYYQQVYLHWKKQVERIRKKRVAKYSSRNERDYNSQQKTEYKQSKYLYNKKHRKNRKSNSLESNQTNQTEHSVNYQKKINEVKYSKASDHQQERIKEEKRESMGLANQENNLEMKSETTKRVESNKDGISFVKNEKGQQEGKVEINPQNQLSKSLYSFPTKSVSISSSSTKLSAKTSKVKKQTQQDKHKNELLKEISIIKLNEELQEMSDKISQEANQFHDRRVIAFQRIQFLLQYYNIPIKLFGSCANGIAIRNSDIDIAIDNSILTFIQFLPENQRIKAALEKMEELFLTQPCVIELKCIKTAAIPVIKMTIDTSIYFLDPSIGEAYFELNREHNSGVINADITVETRNKLEECSHLGLISTNAINKWISEISSLHSIVIVMKELFSKKRLSCTYEGGLNTFSMIVLFMAYIIHAKLEQEENAAIVLQKMLRFYVYQFDQKQQGIDILNKENNTIFYVKNLVNIEGSPKLNKQKADLEIKDPMNQQKNMTRNCYSFPQIRNLFKDLLQKCFDKGHLETKEFFYNQKSKEYSKEQMLGKLKEKFIKRNVFSELLTQENQFLL